MKYKGYAGKFLLVDLGSGSFDRQALTDDLVEKFIGGRGFAAKILYDTIEPDIDPLAPENKLFFVTGPVVGTLIPTGSRFAVATKSPLTMTLTTGYCGGHFGPTMKFAGFDGVLVSGKASSPVYLYIEDGRAEIRDASHLWGLDTIATTERLKKELGWEVQVACIGPAGENLVRYASIMHEQHAAGRGGPGAVMGSKNLKAIAIKGTLGIQLATPKDRMLAEAYDLHQTILGSPVYGGFRDIGTCGMMPSINDANGLPAENFRHTYFADTLKLGPEELKKYIIRYESCYGCPVVCGSVVRFQDDRGGFYSERIEHESLWALGPACNISNLEAIMRAAELCDRMGMDTMSAGITIAFAIEAVEQGLLSKEDVDGLPLKWGNAEVLEPLLARIAARQGIGNLLAEGSRTAASKIGGKAPELAMHCKGLEIPAYDPRGFFGMALNYATAARGADHNRAFTIAAEFLGLLGNLERHSYEGKAKLTRDMQDSTAIIDSAIMCMFTVDLAISIADYARCINLVTGLDLDQTGVYWTGRRINDQERLFVTREGLDASADRLPTRFVNLPSGDGQTVDVGRMIQEYYALRGWDPQGIPRPEHLREIGISE